MALVLIARMTTREGEQDHAAELIHKLAAASSAEPGNVHYIPHRDPDNPRVFMIYEQYRDKAAFEEHGQTEHFQTIAAGELFPLMEGRERTFYETIGSAARRPTCDPLEDRASARDVERRAGRE